MKTIETGDRNGFSFFFFNSQLYKLSTNESLKQKSPESLCERVLTSHNTFTQWNRKQKKARHVLSCLQASHGGPSRLEPPALEGLCVVVWQRPLCQMARVWRAPPPTLVKMPQHQPEWARVLSGEKMLSDYSSPITNLQWHRRLWGHPDMVITPPLLGGRHGAETLNGARCLHPVCASICWRLLRLRRPQRTAGMQTIIWHFPTIPRNLKRRKMASQTSNFYKSIKAEFISAAY